MLVVSALFVSCGEDFLDLQPHDSVSYDQAIENADDAQVALNGVYSAMRSGSLYSRYLTLFPDVMTDAVLASVGYTNQLGTMYKWEYVPGTGDVESVWYAAYVTVARANNIINKIDEGIEGNEDDLADIKGQALFARALMHFELVRLFGDAYTKNSAGNGVPYILKTDVNNAPAREKVDQVYAMVIDDLTDALNLIDAQGSQNSGYATKSACEALLARVYLNMGDAKAADYATDVINSGIFSFYSASAEDFPAKKAEFLRMWEYDEGSEIIFRLIYTPTEVAASLGRNYYNDAQGPPNPDYLPTQWILDLYDPANDMRYDVYFDEDVTTSQGFVATLINKYPGNPNFTENGANMPKLFRLAEMYLIAAESYAEHGNEPEARNYLNQLRLQRIDGYTEDNTISGQALKDAIWEERLKELAFEGQYWFDLKRKQMGFERTPQPNTSTANDISIAPDNHRWLWPIPQAEMNGNDNMVQNPNY